MVKEELLRIQTDSLSQGSYSVIVRSGTQIYSTKVIIVE